MKLFFSSHSLLYPVKDNTFLIYQLLTRKGVLIDIQFLSDFYNFSNSSTKYKFKDISFFSLSNCLLDNPNGLFSDLNSVVLDEELSFDDIINKLKFHSILVDNQDSYVEKLGKKKNLFDSTMTGNFHQNIGDYVLKNHSENAEMWWITQKFKDDYLSTTDTPYSWVQQTFMNEFFTREKLEGKKMLDFGCGIGFYSSFFSRLGANVVGVDPSEKYLSIANQIHSDESKVSYLKSEFERLSDFDVLGCEYDCIFLSDVLLYYFEPYKKMEMSPKDLLTKLNGLLKKNGRIYIMDPHGFFHLQPWFDSNKPFVMMLEYVNRKYRVTPSLEELSIAIEDSGLTISKIRELKYKGDEKSKMYYSEFPFWWFFELKKNEYDI